MPSFLESIAFCPPPPRAEGCYGDCRLAFPRSWFHGVKCSKGRGTLGPVQYSRPILETGDGILFNPVCAEASVRFSCPHPLPFRRQSPRYDRQKPTPINVRSAQPPHFLMDLPFESMTHTVSTHINPHQPAHTPPPPRPFQSLGRRKPITTPAVPESCVTLAAC